MKLSPNRIVVGVDGSPCSAAALRWAMREALDVGSDVEAVLVWSDPWGIDGPASLLGLGDEGLAKLKTLVSDEVRHAADDVDAHGVRITERVVAGHVAETLVVESETARLLVLGTAGRTGLRRLVLGSVSHRCAQLAHVPVVIVPSPAVNGEVQVAQHVGADLGA